MLTIDSIITDAITNSQSPAAFKVRQLCADTAAKCAEEARSYELNKINSILEKSGNVSTQPPGQQPPAGLSEAALAQHAQTQGGYAGAKRASVAGDSNNTGLKAPKKGKPDLSLIDQASTNVITFFFLFGFKKQLPVEKPPLDPDSSFNYKI